MSIQKPQIAKVIMSFFALVIFFSPARILGAPYYEGKRIMIVVGFGPGGGYDRMARILAKHLPKYIPGKPAVIVENMPGGATIVAANHLYNIAKPDGLTLGAFGRGLPFAQLLKTEGVKFDIAKYAWIGSPAVEATVLSLRTDLPFKSVSDLTKANSPIMLGSTGPAESSGQFCILLKEFLGLNFKLITYPSGADINLAIERKEVDGRAASYSGIRSYIERGLLRPLIRGRVSEPGIENLPVDEDLVTDQKGKTIMAMRSAPERMGRPYVAPPRTPPEVMRILTGAFSKAARDPDVKDEAKKLMMEVEYVSADECMKILNYIFNQPEEIVHEFSRYIKF